MGYDVGSAIGYLDLDTSKWKNGMKTAFQDLKAFQDSSQSVADKMTSIGNGMMGAGKQMTLGLTVPLATMGAGMVAVTANFEKGMSEVAAISGATGDDLDRLAEKAKEMGASTKFSATESSEALKYMAMAGWDTEKMLGGLEGVMNLAAASGENLGTVSDIVTDSMTAFGLAAEESTRFADVLAQASSKSNTNVSLMGETFKYVAPVAGALGYSVEDTAVAVGLMANAGIKGSQAGTALRGTLSRLAKPTKESQEAMDDLGISITNSDGSMKTLNDIMMDMRYSFKDLTADQKASYAAMLGGQEAMSGLLSIVNASEEDFNKLNEAIYNSDGAAQTMADTMNDNLAGQLVLLKSAVEGISIAFGELMLPAVKGLVSFLQGLADKINGMSESQKKFALGIATFVAALGPLLLIGGKLLTSLASLQTAVKLIGPLLGGISLPVMAVVAAVGLLALAWQKDFGGIQEKTAIVFRFIQEIVGVFLGWFKEAWEGDLGSIKETASAIFSGIEAAFSATLDIIVSLFEIFAGLLSGDWEEFWGGIKNLFAGILDLIKGVWDAMWNALKLIAMGYVAVVQGVAKGILDGVLGIFSGAKDAMFEAGSNVFNWLKDGMSAAWDGLTTWVEEKLAWLTEKLSAIWDTITGIANANESSGGGGGGSFALGLPYVPYNGFQATLHEGERVLTKAENRRYNGESEGSGGDTYIFQSPKALTPAESARQMKKAKKELLLGF